MRPPRRWQGTSSATLAEAMESLGYPTEFRSHSQSGGFLWKRTVECEAGGHVIQVHYTRLQGWKKMGLIREIERGGDRLGVWARWSVVEDE